MPVDRGHIDQQLREIGEGERWWEEREFRALPQVLFSDESIRGVVRGRLLGHRRPRLTPAAHWLIVATDQRIICLKQEKISRRQVEVAADQITRFRQQFRLRSVQLVIETGANRLRIRVPKDEATRFSTAVAQLVPRPASHVLPPDLEPLAWIPGFTTVAALPGVAGIVAKVSMLSPPAPTAPGRVERLESMVGELQADVDRLQQQVRFLEDLLATRTPERFLPESSSQP